MPLEADEFWVYTLTKIKKLDVFNFITLTCYISLRNLICARLTLFNARHGGEPPRLFLLELEEANESVWISSAQLQALDDIDRKLLKIPRSPTSLEKVITHNYCSICCICYMYRLHVENEYSVNQT